MEGLKSLLKSRKFWLAIVGVVQVIVLDGLGIAPEIWQAVAALLAVLIGAIAVEDVGKRFGGKKIK